MIYFIVIYSVVDAQYIFNDKGTRYLLFKNYMFTLNNLRGNRIFWVCRGYQSHRCRCRLVTDLEGVLQLTNQGMAFEHNHDEPTKEITRCVQIHGIGTFEQVSQNISKLSTLL